MRNILSRVAYACVLLLGCSSGKDPVQVVGVTMQAAQGDAGATNVQKDKDAVGWVESYSTNTFASGTSGGFFASLGTNGRTCNTCHVQENAWSITPAFARTVGRFDPLFAPVDGSDCPPTTPGQTADAKLSTALLDHGVFRIELAIPANADFTLASATNPKSCAIAPGSAAAGGKLFAFRRPLPTTNLVFSSAIMWDGRETLQSLTTTPDASSHAPLLFNLADQANAATLGHAQGSSIVATPAQSDIVSFEMGLFTAQSAQLLQSVSLTSNGANGGPSFLATTVAPTFFIGKNDPLQSGFTNAVFDVFAAWEPTSPTHASLNNTQKAIGRGEAIFNKTTFVIHDVPGLNSTPDDPLYNPADPLAGEDIVGGCGVCHNSPNVGNHSTPLPINIGTTKAQPKNNDGSANTVLKNAHLPVYTLAKGTSTVAVTDPGRALISGRFLDAGKVKGPNLRGLAGRAPYFHNGSAADLKAVVAFYNARFAIGLTPAQADDLVAFLEAL
jgi:cytochrome c peroxidase